MDPLQRFVSSIKTGIGGVLFIEGEAGAGKTHALNRLDALAHQSGVRVLYAQCSRQASSTPWAVTRQLLDFSLRENAAGRRRDHAEELEGDVVDTIEQLVTNESTHDLTARMQALFLHLASVTPTIIAVDDIPRADSESLKALGFLASRARRLGLGVVVTAGREETPSDVQALEGLGALYWTESASVYTLPPIDKKQAAEIANQVLGIAAPAEIVSMCQIECAGNPLLYRELLRSMRRLGRLPSVPGQTSLKDLDLRPLAWYITDHVTGIAPDAQDFLMALAALGVADSNILTPILDRSKQQVDNTASHLVRAGILTEENQLNFVHPVVREAYRQLAGGPEGADIHRRCARKRFEEKAPYTCVASHLMYVPASEDAAVLTAMRRGAREAISSGDFLTARKFLERAVNEGCTESPASRAVARDLGFLLLGHWPCEAPDVLRRAYRAERRPACRAHLACALADSLSWGDEPDEAMRALRRALSNAKTANEFNIVYSKLLLVDSDVLRTHSSNTLPARREVRTTLDAATAELAASSSLLEGMIGNTHDALRLSFIATERRSTRQHLSSPDGSSTLAVLTQLWADHIDDADRRLQRVALGYKDECGPNASRITALEAIISLKGGRVELAAMKAKEALAQFPLSPFGWVDWVLRLHLLQALVVAGELETVRQHLDQLHVAAVSEWGRAVCGQVEGWLLACAGSYGEAADRLAASGRDLEGLGLLNPDVQDWRSNAALLYAKCDRLAVAASLADAAVANANQLGAPCSLGRALVTFGVVHKGDWPTDQPYSASISEGLALLQDSHNRTELATALLLAGDSAFEDGDLDLAFERLRACELLADRIGAGTLTVHAAAGLQQIGDRGSSDSTMSLTASEWRVAEEVANGFTNQEASAKLCVTLRTVEFHLTNIYRKLGISGRSELGSALASITDKRGR